VDLHVDRRDGDLGAVAGLAGDGLDLDGAVGDFRDLFFKQLADEFGVGPRQDDLDAVAVLLDVEDDGVDAVVDVVRLAGDLLGARQDGLGLGVGEGDGGGAVLEALNGALDEVALAGGVDVEDGLAGGLAELLDHQLLADWAAMRPSRPGSMGWSPFL